MRRNLFQWIISIALVLSWLSLSIAPQRVQSAAQFDPDAPSDAGYYTDAFTLPNGNLVLTALIDDLSGEYATQYLYNGKTGQVIKQLTDSPLNGSDYTIVALPNGNFVINFPGYDVNVGAVDVGVVYLFNGKTGDLISKLIGGFAGDKVGLRCYLQNGGAGDYTVCESTITVLPSGNFLVPSPHWGSGLGAVTWCSGTGGCTGAVSSANSLVGSTLEDQVGCQSSASGSFCYAPGVIVLPNGNYLVISPFWDNGAVANAGAVTWCNGTSGCSGPVSKLNSLVGSSAENHVEFAGTPVILTNGHYVVSSVTRVIWCDGTQGCKGSMEEVVSLVTNAWGEAPPAVTALPNGNYVVNSPGWNNYAGAVTWCSGIRGCTGTVSSDNSLVGSSINSQIIVLTNGNYVATGSGEGKGAVIWCNGQSGCVGTFSSANSLIGSNIGDGDFVSVTPLRTGNYVVHNPSWNNGAIVDAGAVTWCNGTNGCKGVISAANSLVGSHTGDMDNGQIIWWLGGGNYAVHNPNGDDGTAVDVGTVTWCNGANGCKGTISAANSLVGSHPGDIASCGVVELANGNYLVVTENWNNGTIDNAGAITWCRGSRNCTGKISPANSLVGAQSGDIDRITPLTNGNYVVHNMRWNNNGAAEAGIATWCNGSIGCTGILSVANSLVGSKPNDWVGYGIATSPTGDYFVLSPYWDNNDTQDAGAATWCDGTRGCSGVLSTANSLLGGTTGDRVGFRGVTFLTNGNYVIRSPYWSNGEALHAGAVTWCRNKDDCLGAVSVTNSLVGSSVGDHAGEVEPFSGVFELANGNYIVESPDWNSYTGAITWCSGQSGCQGAISTTNSLIGITVADSYTGKRTAVTQSLDGNYVVSGEMKAAAITNTRAATFGDGWFGTFGLVTPDNSAIGNLAFDRVNNQLVIGQAGDSVVTLLRPNFRPLKAYLPLAYK